MPDGQARVFLGFEEAFELAGFRKKREFLGGDNAEISPETFGGSGMTAQMLLHASNQIDR
jgi:hypothetical protein